MHQPAQPVASTYSHVRFPVQYRLSVIIARCNVLLNKCGACGDNRQLTFCWLSCLVLMAAVIEWSNSGAFAMKILFPPQEQIQWCWMSISTVWLVFEIIFLEMFYKLPKVVMFVVIMNQALSFGSPKNKGCLSFRKKYSIFWPLSAVHSAFLSLLQKVLLSKPGFLNSMSSYKFRFIWLVIDLYLKALHMIFF